MAAAAGPASCWYWIDRTRAANAPPRRRGTSHGPNVSTRPPITSSASRRSAQARANCSALVAVVVLFALGGRARRSRLTRLARRVIRRWCGWQCGTGRSDRRGAEGEAGEGIDLHWHGRGRRHLADEVRAPLARVRSREVLHRHTFERLLHKRRPDLRGIGPAHHADA